MSWAIDIGVSPGNRPDGTPKRRQWARRGVLREREPLRSELTDLMKHYRATEIRAASLDGKTEIVCMQHWYARRAYL